AVVIVGKMVTVDHYPGRIERCSNRGAFVRVVVAARKSRKSDMAKPFIAQSSGESGGELRRNETALSASRFTCLRERDATHHVASSALDAGVRSQQRQHTADWGSENSLG